MVSLYQVKNNIYRNTYEFVFKMVPMKKQIVLQKLILWNLCIGFILFAGTSYNSTLYAQPASSDKVKVALIYTVTTPELKEDMEREVREQLGNDVEMLIYEVPSVFEEIRATGYVTAAPAAQLITTYMNAVEAGADAILSICSTVADIAYSMQDVTKYIGVPIVMINEEMCREAVRKGQRIAVMATFPTAIMPTKSTLLRVAREMGCSVEVTEVLIKDGFGLDQEQFKALMAAKAGEVADQTDVFLFAQGSMAYCETYIAEMYRKTVLSNPRFGAKALKDALVAKGSLKN